VRFLSPSDSTQADGMCTGEYLCESSRKSCDEPHSQIVLPSRRRAGTICGKQTHGRGPEGEFSSEFPLYEIEVDGEKAGKMIHLTGAALHRVFDE
jgi:hypothetical protein